MEREPEAGKVLGLLKALADSGDVTQTQMAKGAPSAAADADAGLVTCCFPASPPHLLLSPPIRSPHARAGFSRVEGRLEDASLDNPRAPELFEQFKQQASDGGWLTAA